LLKIILLIMYNFSMFNILKKKQTIGLALGGGAARGLAHIGVLKVFEKNRIPIDCITGVSVGSIIGALYATGLSASTLEELAQKLKWNQLVSLIPTRGGIASNKALADFILDIIKVNDFKNLHIPFRALATDITTGNPIVYKEGPLMEAIRASCQFPGIFAPLDKPRNLIFDGGLVENVPVTELLKMNPSVAIAVDVIPHKNVIFNPRNLLQLVDRSIDLLLKTNSAQGKQKAHIVIEPVTEEIYSFDKDKANRLIELGERTTEKALPQILSLIK